MTIGAAVAVYATVGLILVALGPGRAEIVKQVRELRGDPFLNSMMERQAPPEWKVVLFGVILVVGAVLLWPLLVAHLVRQRTLEKREQREWEEILARGLQHSRMGGAGEVSCQDCGYVEGIVSFTHGYMDDGRPCGTFGYQCQACGQFHNVHDRGSPVVESALRCACGGQLSRDEVLFCPKCRSRKLGYQMEFIT